MVLLALYFFCDIILFRLNLFVIFLGVYVMPEYIIHPNPDKVCGVRLIAGDFIREGDFIADPSSGKWKKANHHLIGEKIRKGSKLFWVRPAKVYEHPSPPAIYGTPLVVGDVIQEEDMCANPCNGNWEKVSLCDIGSIVKERDSEWKLARPEIKKK